MRFSSRFFVPVILLLLGANLVCGQSISSFSPAFGSSNDLSFIDINGSGFAGGTLVVKYGNAQDLTAGATSDTHIQSRVPSTAPLGQCLISVSKNGGPPAFSSQFFTVIGPGPYVTNFNPYFGAAATMVTIGGAHFSGVTNVSFNGKSGTSLAVALDYSLTVRAPSGVTSGPITVKGTNGTFTTISNFFGPPVITGYSPFAGRAGTNVIIIGTNFLGTTGILFDYNSNPTPATDFTVLSNNAVRVGVPAGAQTGPLLLMVPGASYPTSSNFVVQPTIFGFSPGFGPVGTSVTVTGANFNVGTPSVKFGGVPAATPTGVTFSQLTVIVPAGATSGPVTLTTTDGSFSTSNLFYLPASITSFTPTNSAPGTSVKITGINFTNASAVTFNGTAASFVVTNNTTIGATVPAGFSTGRIFVTTPAGTTNSAGLFYAASGITSFLPTHGLPGTNVVITGSNFLGATDVRFNGVNATFIPPTNNTTLVATVPNGAQTGPITVGAPGGTNTSAASFVLDYASDVSVSIFDAPDPVFVGSNLTYTITVANSGPFNAPNVQMTNTLPASVTLKSASTTQGTLSTNNNPITAALGNVTNGLPIIVTLTVVPHTVGTIIDTAGIGSDNLDPGSANNTFSVTTTVLPLPLLAIQRANGNQLNISWPVALTNFGLQAKDVLSTNAWSNVITAPMISGNQNVVTETNNGGSRFYRLKK
jgi:uncharacterized repeat protein (TIGR01451 family)